MRDTFFSYIDGRLSGEVTGTELALPESLVLGSDEEKAMTKALDNSSLHEYYAQSI